MLEVLHFVFSGFWIWLGTVFLVATFGTTLGRVIAAARSK